MVGQKALLAMLLGSLLLRRALRPLKSLHKGVKTISEGEYAYRMETGNKASGIQDDLTLLSEGFNEMAASLEASENWKRQIISDTAHELRTPVSLIMGNLEMILDGVYEADRSRMEILYRQSEHLARLIRDLQTLAAEESRQVHTEEREFSLRELAQVIAGDFSVLTDRKGISLDLVTGDEDLFRGDRNKTRQVLKNLLANALRFTPAGGRITIRQYSDERGLFLEVEDTGPGIPEDERERVFDRFYKLDRSRNSEGSGLGLAISRLLVSNQGGSLDAHGGSDGGTLMRIRFPVVPRNKEK
jgi:two-component system sensor histidine kinase BaeS